MSKTRNNVGLVLIHGAGLGSWIWNDITSHLTKPYLAINFPERDAPKASRTKLTLEDYVDSALQQIEQWDTHNIVIVGHSLGGVVALEVAGRLKDRLQGFVGVAAAIPKSKSSFISTLPFPKRLLMGAILRIAGTQPPESAIKSGLCNDLEPQQTKQVVDSFKAESLKVYTDKTTSEYPNVPSLYIRSMQDKEFGVSLQSAMACNLPSVKLVDIEAGHMPMLSQPETLSLQLNDFIDTLK